MREEKMHVFDFLDLVSKCDQELGKQTPEMQKKILSDGLPRYPRSQLYSLLLEKLSKRFESARVPAEKHYSWGSKIVLATIERPIYNSDLEIRQTKTGSRTYWMENQNLYMIFYLTYDGTVRHCYLKGKTDYSSQLKSILNPDLTIKVAEHIAEKNRLRFRESRFDAPCFYVRETLEKIPILPLAQKTLSEVIEREYKRLDRQIQDRIKS